MPKRTIHNVTRTKRIVRITGLVYVYVKSLIRKGQMPKRPSFRMYKFILLFLVSLFIFSVGALFLKMQTDETPRVLLNDTSEYVIGRKDFAPYEDVGLVINMPALTKFDLKELVNANKAELQEGDLPWTVQVVFMRYVGGPLQRIFVKTGSEVQEGTFAMSLLHYRVGRLDTIIPEVEAILKDGKKQFVVTIPRPKFAFRPGQYNLNMEIETKEAILVWQYPISWGILIMNSNKSIYVPGEQALLGAAVLDRNGHAVCDASITLQITTPRSQMAIFSTEERTIIRSSECAGDTTSNAPDYSVFYDIPHEIGLYQILMIVTTKDEVRLIESQFELFDTIPVSLERVLPTKIFPLEPISASLIVTANEDFDGIVEERVPSSFEVIQEAQGRAFNRIIEEPDTKIITWEVSLLKDEQIELSYSFVVPDTSPAVYLLGPLRLLDSQEGKVLFEETTQWQIIADNATDFIISDGFDTAQLLSAEPFVKTPNAAHLCSVQPFSQTIVAGEQADYTVELENGGMESFGLRIGDLPDGAKTFFEYLPGDSRTNIPLTFTTERNSQTGSMTIILVHEVGGGEELISTTCKFNIIILKP